MKEKNTLSVSCCEAEPGLPGLGGGTAAAWAVKRSRDCLRCEVELRLPGL